MRFYRQVADASMLSFIDLDLKADLFTFSSNQTALQRAETMDVKLVLITSIEDLPAEEVVHRLQGIGRH